VVVLLSGAPTSFPNDQRAYYSWNPGKERNAAGHGARGIITIRRPDDEVRATWDRVCCASRGCRGCAGSAPTPSRTTPTPGSISAPP
jgi:hypothetical protein